MPNKVVTISGQPGAGSTTVGKLIAQKSSLNYFSPGQLFKDIGKGSVREQYYYSAFKKLCDNKSLTIPEMSEKDNSSAVNALWNTELGSSSEFHKVIDELQKHLSENANMVIDGKLSLKMIEKPTLKVWLKASLDTRASRLTNRDGVPIEEMRSLLLERQSKERKEWHTIYGFDYWEQEKLADLVIDTSKIPPERVAEIISLAL